MMTFIIVIIMSTGLTWAETGLNGLRLIINENKAPNEKKVGLQKLMVRNAKGQCCIKNMSNFH